MDRHELLQHSKAFEAATRMAEEQCNKPDIPEALIAPLGAVVIGLAAVAAGYAKLAKELER